MRSIFFKIFLWFWVANILVGGVQLLTTIWTSSHPQRDHFRAMTGLLCGSLGHQAVEHFEQHGQEGLGQYLANLERNSGIQLFVFTGGKPLLPQQTIPVEAQELIRHPGTPVASGPPGPFLETQPITGSQGRSYMVMMHMPPPELMTDWLANPEIPILRLIPVILMAGAVCYGLARYLTRPLRRLRQATRQLANGDLSVRIGTRMGKRRDEIGDLGVDFDFMAEQVESLMTSQRRLLRDISHELRSPLTRLNVALELARQRTGTAAAGALDRIELEVNRLNELIGQLLNLTRLETHGEVNNGRIEIDLSALLTQIVEDADFEARSRGRHVQITESEPLTVKGMPELLRSAVENVVRNAVYYTADGTGVDISLRRSPDEKKPLAVVCVRDHGPGVPDADLARIFQPFYRVADARDRHSGGAGLGLAITDRAVRLHGGMVRAANVPEGGLLVEIILPLAACSADLPATPAGEP